MNLQAEKIELVRLVLDTDDRYLIQELKALLKSSNQAKENSQDLDCFYENFRSAVREIKHNSEGNIHLREAKDWLNEV